MDIGYIGLGKMGLAMCQLLQEKGHTVIAYNRGEDGRTEGRYVGLNVKDSIADMMAELPETKILWLMVTHTAVDAVLAEVVPHLKAGDIVIDGGNSRYTETILREVQLKEKGIHFLDAGISGGPAGARTGTCVMIGGEKAIFEKVEPIFKDISVTDGYGYMGRSGAGHFVKMVHNGIEYGMMQAIGEGFEVLHTSDFNLDMERIADLYQHKSVIESRLVGWLAQSYKKHTAELEHISGSVSHSGEGQWTVETAKELGVPVPIIEGSLQFRVDSTQSPSYTGKVVSALRHEFGGHDVADNTK